MKTSETPAEGEEAFEEAHEGGVEEEEVEYEEVEEEEVEEEEEDEADVEDEGLKVSSPRPHGAEAAPTMTEDAPKIESSTTTRAVKSSESEADSTQVEKGTRTSPSAVPHPSGTEIDLNSIEAQASKARGIMPDC